ncbi:hypothetical protein C2W62_02460 [Candidatus Entotheonella serta]|nr:hypothetical protein C2W62_02460 [Candidatus Entotheonella serta]
MTPGQEAAVAQNTGKNIIVCLDGTGNLFKDENSNVVKLFQVLRRERGVQVAYYNPGVGTLADPSYKTPIAKKLNKAFGLAFGRGITRNVEQAYAYLMEHYDPGDRVFLFVETGTYKPANLNLHGNNREPYPSLEQLRKWFKIEESASAPISV